MYVNIKNVPIHVFLKSVHTDMQEKFLKPIASQGAFGSAKEAEELQTFFRDLKKQGSKDAPDDATMSLIYNEIQASISGDPMLQNFTQGLFRKKYDKNLGEPFERELAHTIQTVLNMASNDNNNLLKFEDIFVGQDVANIGNIQVDKISAKVLQKLSDASVRMIKDKKTGQMKEVRKNYLDITAKAGKIDAKGATITINANASPKLKRIAELLQNATFSAKNYKDVYLDGKRQDGQLSLGATNPYKAYYGILSALGYNDPTIISKTFAKAYWSWNKKSAHSEDIARYITQIRQVYELTGTGLLYNNNQSFGAVKYIIYNAPNGEICVKSTGEIMNEFLSNTTDLRNPFTSHISIAKSSFKDI